MIRRVVRHLVGYFQQCKVCGSEPHHIEGRGRSISEPPRAPGEPVIRHWLECRCGISTARRPTLELCETEWGDKWAQQLLPLPNVAPIRRKRAGAA